MTGRFSESGRRPHTNVAFHVASPSRSSPILLKMNLKLPLMLLAVCTKVMGLYSLSLWIRSWFCRGKNGLFVFFCNKVTSNRVALIHEYYVSENTQKMLAFALF